MGVAMNPAPLFSIFSTIYAVIVIVVAGLAITLWF